MFLITSPKNECTLASQLMEGRNSATPLSYCVTPVSPHGLPVSLESDYYTTAFARPSSPDWEQPARRRSDAYSSRFGRDSLLQRNDQTRADAFPHSEGLSSTPHRPRG